MHRFPKGRPQVLISRASVVTGCFVTTILFGALNPAAQTSKQAVVSESSIPPEILVRIIQAEDERRWNNDLGGLLTDKTPAVRRRAALAAGRIGDQAAVPALAELFEKDSQENVREMGAFALGEIESTSAAEALLAVLRDPGTATQVRARAVEAVGKITATVAKEDKLRVDLNSAILAVLKFESERRPHPDHETTLLALTATIRAKVAEAGPIIADFLKDPDPRIRADAANVLARLRLKEGSSKLRELLAHDPDPLVRANAARALGAAEDKPAFAALLDRALNDADLRVRASAIRALASLNDSSASQPLLKRAEQLSKVELQGHPSEANELLEIATTLGGVLRSTENQDAVTWLKKIRPGFGYAAPELEIAFARIAPASYLQDLGSELPTPKRAQKLLPVQWKSAASLAQGLAEIAALPASIKDRDRLVSQAEALVRSMLVYRNNGLKIQTMLAIHSEYAIPDLLRTLVAFKPKDLGERLREQLRAPDVIIRSTAADLLGELPPEDGNSRALSEALPSALRDGMNDAALSILDALGKQKSASANDAIKTALDSPDHLVRRRAIGILRANGVGDFTSRVGTVKTQNTKLDYLRAVSRANRNALATVTTTKGSFVIELLPKEAPLTVDNFIRLAEKGFFNGQVIPRVVPNFVIQAGDPRGDQNGGPGYSIRCEINEVAYDRGAIGMALSGKDTGGSQWFVTHSPQPHLDGGYTVFGRVVAGMDVVDNVVRGDLIRSVKVMERPPGKRPA